MKTYFVLALLCALSGRFLSQNTPPTNGNEAGSSTEDQAFTTINLLLNNTDPDGDPLKASNFYCAQGGTIQFNANNTLTFTPPLNFFGNLQITYTVCDDFSPAGCVNDTIFMQINPVNDFPIAVNDYGTILNSIETEICVTCNDLEPDGDPLSIFFITSPTHGSAQVTNGNIEYSPTLGYQGLDSMQYRICDNQGLCDTAMLYMNVGNTNNAPIAGSYTVSVYSGGITVFNPTAGASDINGDVLYTQIISQPSMGVLNVLEGGNLSYVGPKTNTCRVDSFLYSACDFQLCDTGVVYINVYSQDTDADGLTDALEGELDADGDSIPNYLDSDSDGDGIPDFMELRGDLSDACNPIIADTDSDGIPDYLDPDSDNDGIPDSEEYNPTADGTPSDCNNDGIPNYRDPNPCVTESFLVPEIFTPNGDGANDTFRIPKLENYPANNLKIMNRWGTLVFEADPYLNDWNGIPNIKGSSAEPLPMGTYFYVLDLKDGSAVQSGYVYLYK